MSVCGEGTYAPCPPESQTAQPPVPNRETAFTGADLTVGAVALPALLVVAAVALRLRRGRAR